MKAVLLVIIKFLMIALLKMVLVIAKNALYLFVLNVLTNIPAKNALMAALRLKIINVLKNVFHLKVTHFFFLINFVF